MERTLRTKRIYALGQYQNIEFTDEIAGLSGDTLTPDLTYKIQLLQVLGMERMINKYLLIKGEVASLTPEKAITYLEEARAELINELKDALPTEAKENITIKGE
jgi:hypothetical protein